MYSSGRRGFKPKPQTGTTPYPLLAKEGWQKNILTIPYFLFLAPCSPPAWLREALRAGLLPVHCSLFIAHCSLLLVLFPRNSSVKTESAAAEGTATSIPATPASFAPTRSAKTTATGLSPTAFRITCGTTI